MHIGVSSACRRTGERHVKPRKKSHVDRPPSMSWGSKHCHLCPSKNLDDQAGIASWARRNLDLQKIFTGLYSSSDYKSSNQFACCVGRILAGK